MPVTQRDLHVISGDGILNFVSFIVKMGCSGSCFPPRNLEEQLHFQIDCLMCIYFIHFLQCIEKFIF